MTLSAGGQQSLAVKADGALVQWGCNNAPAPLAALSGVSAVSAGPNCTGLAVKADGSLVAWGYPYVPQAAQTGVKAAQVTQDYSIALKTDGSVVTWENAVEKPRYTVPAGLNLSSGVGH